jgi:hypothetical protein
VRIRSKREEGHAFVRSDSRSCDYYNTRRRIVVARPKPVCAGTVGGAAGLTIVNGNVSVPNAASCTLAFVEVTGNVVLGQAPAF